MEFETLLGALFILLRCWFVGCIRFKLSSWTILTGIIFGCFGYNISYNPNYCILGTGHQAAIFLRKFSEDVELLKFQSSMQKLYPKAGIQHCHHISCRSTNPTRSHIERLRFWFWDILGIFWPWAMPWTDPLNAKSKALYPRTSWVYGYKINMMAVSMEGGSGFWRR